METKTDAVDAYTGQGPALTLDLEAGVPLPPEELDFAGVAVPEENEEEILDLASKAIAAGKPFAAAKLTAMAEEIRAVKTMEPLMNENFVPFVRSWTSNQWWRREAKAKLEKRMARTRKYVFYEMGPLNEITIECRDLFVGAVYAFMSRKPIDEVSYFQPKLMVMVKKSNPEVTELATKVAAYYAERI